MKKKPHPNPFWLLDDCYAFALPEPLQIHLGGYWKNFIEGTITDV